MQRDYLEVLDGTEGDYMWRPLYDTFYNTKFCGTNPGSLTSSGSSLTLRFQSDYQNHNTIPYGQDKKSNDPIGYRVIVDTGKLKNIEIQSKTR